MTADIKLKNVNYRYPLSKIYALQEINCKFEPGKFYGIIGENGAGKTSLCNLIRGLIPHFYNGELSGDILINGTDVRELDDSKLAVNIGYVFQNPYTQISGIKETVFEEIAMGLENLGVEKMEMIDRVLSVSKQLEIENLLDKNPNALSGGQRQRVAFASIIVMDAQTMVIDEPTSQLDPEGTQNVFDIIHMLKETGKTIILVENKIDLIAQYSDEVIVMEKGKIVINGPTEKVLSNRDLLKHKAGIPIVAQFGHAMEDEGKSLSKIPITVNETIHLIKERIERGSYIGN
ncbi:energy-coupling factor ABC transporter ATP-binding protein [Bacillus sp. JJ1562]|uniref:energy-coupling factor ABC transporter ATP-binding protein n=1 Tax=Bacillus sp. JJ1562 TaxID=3122960 RepID=UPI003002EBB4